MNRAMMAVLALGGSLLAAPAAMAQLSINISVGTPPPPLPVYVQPPLPGADYIWTPGYWAWDDIEDAYYWVPGTWALAPRPGLLWTPPWWGWSSGAYIFHAGYWGPHVGFYGGVPYGFGYTGLGYQGGYWNGGHVYYNRVVNNITNVHITNVYQQNVVVNQVKRISYNGGPGGVQARPDRQDWIAAHEAHVAPTRNQFAHFAAARSDPRSLAVANHGRPPIVATPRPMTPNRVAFNPQQGHWQPPMPGRPSATMAAPGYRPQAPAADRDPPMPVVHRGGQPDWQRNAAIGAAPQFQPQRQSQPQPWHNAPPQWHGAPPPMQGGHGWGGPPRAPAPRVAFHAPPPRPHPPAPPHGGGGHHDHHG